MALDDAHAFNPLTTATREKMAEEAYVSFRDAEITLAHPDLEDRFFIGWDHLPEEQKVPFRAVASRFCDIAASLYCTDN